MNNIKIKKIMTYSAIGIGFVVVATIFGILLFGMRKTYFISGVPYCGIYNHKGDWARLSNDISCGAASIVKYWKPDLSQEGESKLFANINRDLSSRGNELVTLPVVKKYLDSQLGTELSSRIEEIKTEDLGKYINSKSKTPLFMFLAVSEDQPIDITYHPAFVLTGINNKEKKVRMHSYWLGSDFEVSYEKFEKMWEKMSPTERHSYLVVQPVGMKNKVLGNPGQTEGFPRVALMDESLEMFKNYSIARGAVELSRYDIAEEYLTKIKNSPNYEKTFPEFFKVRVLTQLAQIALFQKENEKALEFAKLAVNLNSDLDQPDGDWQGYEILGNSKGYKGVSGDAYLALANAYYATGDIENAKENYEKTLAVSPLFVAAGSKLEEIANKNQ